MKQIQIGNGARKESELCGTYACRSSLQDFSTGGHCRVPIAGCYAIASVNSNNNNYISLKYFYSSC